MISFVRRKLESAFGSSAVVLNYGRVGNVSPDIWRNSVSLKNFDTHLQIYATEWNVTPLRDLVAGLRNKKIGKKAVALCFDGSYADLYSIVQPLLEKYKMPATFFINEHVIGGASIYWWDELERLILYSRHLPPVVSLTIGGEGFSFNVARETVLTDNLKEQFANWNVLEKAPNLRAELYMQLHMGMEKLANAERMQVMDQIRNTTSIVQRDPALYSLLTHEHLKALGASELVEVGYKVLPETATDKENLAANKIALEKITGQTVKLLSVNDSELKSPHIEVFKDAGYNFTLTNREAAIRKYSDTFQGGRFQVKNYNLYTIRKVLQQWKKSSIEEA